MPDEPPKITIPKEYQEYSSNAAFNALTGKFEGNIGTMYDYRLYSRAGVKPDAKQEEFAKTAEKTVAANAVCLELFNTLFIVWRSSRTMCCF